MHVLIGGTPGNAAGPDNPRQTLFTTFFKMRSHCEASNLGTACAWEETRVHYFTKIGRYRDADEARARLKFYERKMSEVTFDTGQ